jgi:hypothetical protein
MWRLASYGSSVDSRLESQRHIILDATFRILCATAHKMRENRMHGSEGGEA